MSDTAKFVLTVEVDLPWGDGYHESSKQLENLRGRVFKALADYPRVQRLHVKGEMKPL